MWLRLLGGEDGLCVPSADNSQATHKEAGTPLGMKVRSLFLPVTLSFSFLIPPPRSLCPPTLVPPLQLCSPSWSPDLALYRQDSECFPPVLKHKAVHISVIHVLLLHLNGQRCLLLLALWGASSPHEMKSELSLCSKQWLSPSQTGH